MNKLLEKKQTDGKNFSRPRRILISAMAVLLLIAVVLLGRFILEPPYIYSTKTRTLLYHLVMDEPYSPYSYLFVREADFEAQLAAIKESGIPTYFADEPEKAGGKPCLVLTFDDGYEDNYTTAFPLLSQYEIKATVFLIADMIGTEGHLSEEQIREMAKSGLIRFGSHTLSHPKLTELDEESLVRELVLSKERIEEVTGERVEALAYPNGLYNETVEKAAKKAGYRYCYTTDVPQKSYYPNTRLPRDYVSRDMTAADLAVLFPQ